MKREAFWEKLVSELPAYVDYIMNWEIPNELKSNRYGITHYHHPEVINALTELEADEVLLQMIDSTILKNSIISMCEVSAENLKKTLIEKGVIGPRFSYQLLCERVTGY